MFAGLRSRNCWFPQMVFRTAAAGGQAGKRAAGLGSFNEFFLVINRSWLRVQTKNIDSLEKPIEHLRLRALPRFAPTKHNQLLLYRFAYNKICLRPTLPARYHFGEPTGKMALSQNSSSKNKALTGETLMI